MAKPLTWSETIVGRKLPPYPKHIDTVMNTFAHNGQAFPPMDSWLKPAFTKARKNGWIHRTNFGLSIMGGKGEFMWEVTDKGRIEAAAAHERYTAAHGAREQWGKDFNTAYKIWKESQP